MSNFIEATIESAPDHIKERDLATVLLWVITALTVSLILWASFASVQEVVQGTGKVIPSSRLQVVSNLEGGVVGAILVKAGDRVKQGQTLMRLDDTATNADFARSDTSIDALLARAARLEAEANGRPLNFPAALETAAPALVANERALHSAQISSFETEREIARSRLVQAERTALQAEADASARAEALAQATREVVTLKPLVEKGVEPTMSLVRAQSAERQAQSALEAARAAARRASAAQAEARSGVRNVDQRFRATASEALATTRAEIAAQSKSMPALAERVARTEVKAPVAGIVNRVLVTTVGSAVRPGEPLVEVVPEGDTLVIEAAIKPQDISFVRLGQKANVKISAYDYSVYGTLPGTVEQIAPDAVTNERTGESHFTVRVRTDTRGLTDEDGKPLPIGAGMTADVDVLGRDRSIMNYLLTPMSRLKDNAFREK
jgi:adhesin transport system membrane fusion protein